MSEWTPEEAYAAFKKHEARFSDFDIESNEAQTRLELIDTVLFDILDWEKGQVEVEKHCREPGYADYVFIVGSRFPLVVEAKRAGKNFFVKPNSISSDRPVPFSLLAKESPDAKSALVQAIMYATTLGTQFAGITNGLQWLFTLTFVEGQTIDDRQVFVFDSFSSIDGAFRMFWECFSRAGVESNRVVEKLLEKRAKPAPRKLSSEIPNYPQLANRNYYVNELSFVLNKLWDVLSSTEHTEDFVSHCYVSSTYNVQISSYAREILKTRAEADSEFEAGVVEGTKGVNEAIQYGITDKPFIILGEVGRGKSSFLDNLRYFQGKDELKRYIQLEIDFLVRPDFSTEVTDFIYEELESTLLNQFGIDIHENSVVRGVLHTELQRFKNSAKWKSVEGKPEKESELELAFIDECIRSRHRYFKDLLRHLKRGQQKSIAIFFDNLDRRTPEIQEEAFLKAASIARDWGCAVFICLRPETFHDSLRRGVLDSVAPKTFTLAEPDLSVVLKRRFEYARMIVMGDNTNPALSQFVRDTQVGLKLPSVAEILECCELSARKRNSAIEMLAALSNGNIRQLIDLAKRILTSGLLDTKKILRAIKESGGYTIPDFEALKTLLFGDYSQYDPRSSVFLNLFDIFCDDEKEHFFRILALEYLSRFDENSDNEGFIFADDLKVYMQSYYFTGEVYLKHMHALVEAKCVAAQDFRDEDGEGRSTFRLRSRGRFHLYEMTKSFVYLDAMIIDTPIVDSEVRKRMKTEGSIEERLTRASEFSDYLIECAQHLHDATGKDLVLELLTKGAEDIKRIQKNLSGPPAKQSKRRPPRRGN